MSGGKWRSIGAVFAGVLITVVLSTVVDVVLHLLAVYPPWGEPLDHRLSAMATSYRFVISVGAAYATARLAPDRPLRHAVILGLVGTALGALGAAATLGKGLGPDWYPIALAVLALPQCALGGWLASRRAPERTSSVGA